MIPVAVKFTAVALVPLMVCRPVSWTHGGASLLLGVTVLSATGQAGERVVARAIGGDRGTRCSSQRHSGPRFPRDCA